MEGYNRNFSDQLEQTLEHRLNLDVEKIIKHNDDNSDISIEDQCTRMILQMKPAEMDHLMINPKDIIDQASFFKQNRKFFFCTGCGRQYAGVGYAKYSYRIRCSCRTITLTKALPSVQELIRMRTDDISESEDEKLSPVAEPIMSDQEEYDEDMPDQDVHQDATKEPESSAELALEKSSDELEQIPLKEIPQDMQTIHLIMNLEQRLGIVEKELMECKMSLAGTKLENARLQLENSQLRQKLAQVETMTITSTNCPLSANLSVTQQIDKPSTPKANAIGPKETLIYQTATKDKKIVPGSSFAEVARSAPQQQPRTKNIPAIKNPDELARYFAGRPIREPRRIISVHCTMKVRPVGELRQILRNVCHIATRNILNIDFIGRSLCEFHIYQDYANTFKDKLHSALSDKAPEFKILEDLDPLSPSLLRQIDSENKVVEAARKYIYRLERRWGSVKVVGYRKFLDREVARAKSKIEEVTGSRIAPLSGETVQSPADTIQLDESLAMRQ